MIRTIRSDFRGVVCSVCDSAKPAHHAFCVRCYKMLPKKLREGVWKRFGEGYEDAFLAARRFLLDLPINRQGRLYT